MINLLKRILWPATISAVLLVALLASGSYASSDVYPGSTQRTATYTLYGPTALFTETVNTDPAVNVVGQDPQYAAQWSAADVFIIGQVSEGGRLTATIQFSPDDSNYVDAFFWSEDSEGALVAHTHTKVLTASGAGYMRVPIVGDYMRVNIATLGTVTPTIKVTYRNN